LDYEPPNKSDGEQSQENSEGNNDWKLVTYKRKKEMNTDNSEENVEKLPKR